MNNVVIMQSKLFGSLSACTSAADTAVIDAAAEAFEVMLGQPHNPSPSILTPSPPQLPSRCRHVASLHHML